MPICNLRRLAAALTAGALTAGTLAAGSLATAGAALAVPSVPVNDARANATPLGALPATLNVNNTGATVEAGDQYARTIWYAYTPTTSHPVSVRAQSSYDNTLQVWNGSTLVAANDDGYGLDALLTFAATSGQTYLIGYGGLKAVNQGPGTLTVGDAAPAAPAAPTVSVGDGSADVSWVAPADNGTPISGYTVRWYAGGALAGSTDVTGEPPDTTTTVTGLTNGTAYTFTVAATNGVGTSAASGASDPSTPAGAPTAPAAPAAPTAVAGDGSATVTWTAPDDGNSAITGYLVKVYDADNALLDTVPVAGDPPALSTTVSGLTNGHAYHFTVAAQNGVGVGDYSASSNVVTPAAAATRPAAPSAPTATAGDGSVDVSWTAPTDGGSPITSYTVKVYDSEDIVRGTVTVTGAPPALTATVTGLTNGQSYYATVYATNAVDSSASSGISNVVTPAAPVTAPAAPAAPTATAADSSAVVSWTAPDNGGAAISSYLVRVYDGDQLLNTVTVTGEPPALTTTVTGLTNGQAYHFTVAAQNSVGTSDFSASSAEATAASVPAAPSGVTGTPADGSATLSWTAPADGGSPITGYTITAYNGETPAGTVQVTAPATSGTVTGLSNGTAYIFTVTATNAVGTSAASAYSDLVTPVAPVAPSVPTNVVAVPGDTSVALSWSAPFDGRSALTQYTVRIYSGDTLLRKVTVTGNPPATGTVVTGLTNGTPYTFTVDASNAVGTSPRSSNTAAVVPVAPPVNDNRANALPLPALPTVVNVDNTGATVEPGDYKQGTIWYSYTPATTRTVAVAANSSYDNALQVWDGGQLVAARDDYFGLDAALAFPAQAGHTYLIGYGSYRVSNGRTGPGTLSVTDQVPDAPAAPTAAVVDGGTQVSWTAPDNHAGPVTGYTVRAYDGDTLVATVDADTYRRTPQTTATIPGLTNGVAYTFTVTATNLVGPSQESGRSEVLTPTGVPLAPADVTAVAGYQRAVISWTAPANDGGSPLTGYSVQVFNDENTLVNTIQVTGDPLATTATVTGLTNGTAYHFTVTATSALGTSDPSAASQPVTPDVPGNDMRAGALPLPALPAVVQLDNTGATTEPGDFREGTLWYSYTPTTTHRVSLSAQSAFDNTLQVWDGSTLVGSDDDSWNLNALLGFTAEAGHTYLIAFGSFDTAADGSGPGTLIVSDAVPAAPAAPAVITGQGSAMVSWTAPADNGGPITGYTVRAYAGDALAATVQVDATDTAPAATTALVTGLTGGTSYTFTVTANNLVGPSGESAPSSAATPTGVPLAPTGVSAVAGDGSAQVSWTAAADGGSAVTGYSVAVYDGDVLVTTVPVAGDPPATTVTVPGLSNGTAYTFAVTATNSVGTSDASAPSAAVTPVAAPPVNDLRANALPLPALPADVPVDNTGATAEPTDIYGSTIWYSYTPTVTGSVTVSTAGAHDTTLEVWDGSTAIADNDDEDIPDAVTSRLSFLAEAGHTYLIGYGAYEGDTGTGTLSVAPTPAAATAPAAPAAPAAVPADGQVAVSWTAPADNGSPVTGYTVRAYDGDTLAATVPVVGATTTATVTGLTDGTAYTFTVTATNAVGESPASAASDSVIPSPIQGRFQALGGATGTLGAPLAPEHALAGGAAEDFAHGSLFWSSATGAILVQGAIRVEYAAIGGPAGVLGFPTADEADTAGVAGRVSTFQRGSIFWSPSTGAHEVHGLISARYAALGGPAGLLGFPLTDETVTPGAAGRFNTFQHGTVFWSLATGAHEVHGLILARYVALNGPAGLLGFPLTDETATPGAAGQYNAFQGGSIFWSRVTGAHELHGSILARYSALGGPAGLLGFPLTDELGTPDGTGRYNLFQHGSVYWSRAVGAHEVHGAILAAWAAGGYERGPLGYPASDEYAVGANRRSDFTGGYAVWDAATGRVSVFLR